MWSRLIVDYDFAIKRGRKSRDIIPLRFSSTLPTTEDKYSCRCKKVPVPVRSKDSIPKKGALENLLFVYIFYVKTKEIKTKEKIKFEFFSCCSLPEVGDRHHSASAPSQLYFLQGWEQNKGLLYRLVSNIVIHNNKSKTDSFFASFLCSHLLDFLYTWPGTASWWGNYWHCRHSRPSWTPGSHHHLLHRDWRTICSKMKILFHYKHCPQEWWEYLFECKIKTPAKMI